MASNASDVDVELEQMHARATDAGVDLTQIDAMLELSPAERLSVLYETALSLSRLMRSADTDPLV
jgi:hypothetical protein